MIIIGNAGSGKTWLARRLADGIDTPTVHLDELFWQPGGFDVKRDREEVDRLIEESKRTASWVVEGVFGELAERYFAEAELLIWLDIDWETCKTRLLARGAQNGRQGAFVSRRDAIHGLVAFRARKGLWLHNLRATFATRKNARDGRGR